MAVFPLPVKAEMTDSLATPTRLLRFGNGVTHVAPNGLARPIEIWDIITVFSSEADGIILQDFLELHKNHVAFQWQSPRDATLQYYRIVGAVSGTKRNGGGSEPLFFTRQMRFKKTYG